MAEYLTQPSTSVTSKDKETVLRDFLCISEKYTMQDVIEIKRSEKDVKYSMLPWIFLQNLIMVNYKARDIVIESALKEIVSDDLEDSSDDWSVEEEENFERNDEKSESKMLIGEQLVRELNPIDLLVLVWKNSSPELKHVLAYKLFTCRLAIPFCIPRIGSNDRVIEIWPLRSIILDGKTENRSMQLDAIDCPCSVVAFVRLGDICLSKSIIVNNLLADQYHNTFFNKDCPLGDNPRAFSCGLIEAAWRLEANRPEKNCLYLNLRGDGLTYKEEIKMMTKIASVVVVMTKINTLTDSNSLTSLRAVTNCAKAVILAVDAYDCSKEEGKRMYRHYLKSEEFQMSAPKMIRLASGRKIENMSSLIRDLQENITKRCSLTKLFSLQDRLEETLDTTFKIDEHSKYFSRAKSKADELVKLIPEDSKQIKEKLVPLQGKFWRQYTEHLKEGYNITDVFSIEKHENIKSKMKEQRKLQIDTFKKDGRFIKTFLQQVSTCDSKIDILLYIGYLKLHFDTRSRCVLPEFLSKYNEKWKAFKCARDTESKDVKCLQTECELAEFNLAEASFGFEHVIRECGQVYEAIMANKESTILEMTSLVDNLLDFAVNILLLGNPIELMDGDVANVALDWIDAVMRRLTDRIGNKKILNLSILGIQSSGKSTLLNTMFGLQFAVSAGRCTRGVYMQLIPIKSNNIQCKFDYIAVVDTEGLRATELGHLKHDHDNKLATFIIGIADVTIINIKGENTAEIKDILQIVVHAFLRLKLINDKLNLKQNCVFVHQNVPAADAVEKMRQGRQKLVENLDKMTKEAAEQEQIKNVQAFNHVIDFNNEKDVWYFSDLWLGDPPMAPTNPSYSRNCADIREKVITELATLRETFLTITDTLARIKDLWQGILRDDFVYGFRNSLEMKAYKGLETTFQTNVLEIRHFFYDYISLKARPRFGGATNTGDLDKIAKDVISNMQEEADGKLKSCIQDLKKYVEQNDLKDVQSRWIDSKMTKLHLLTDQLCITSETELTQLKNEQEIDITQNKEEANYRRQINERALIFATSMKGKSVSDQEITSSFEKMWKDWFKTIKKSIKQNEDVSSVGEKIMALITEHHPGLKGFLTSYHGRFNFEKMQTLRGSLKTEELKFGEHLEITNDHWLKRVVKNIIKREDEKVQIRRQAYEIADTILLRIDDILETAEKEDTRFNVKNVTNILGSINATIIDHNDNHSRELHFVFLQPFTALIISHVYFYIVGVFQKHEKEYLERHSLVRKLDQYKETASGLFRNVVKQRSGEIIASDLFVNELQKVTREHVDELLPNIVKKFVTTHFSTKFTIISRIMDHLVEHGTFPDICRYLIAPFEFAESWLQSSMEKMLFDDKYSYNAHSKYASYAESEIQKIFEQVRKAIFAATASCKTRPRPMSAWINTFCSQMSSGETRLPVSATLFDHVIASTNINHDGTNDNPEIDLENFRKHVEEQLSKKEDSLREHYRGINSYSVRWKTNPLKGVLDAIWGCKENCPFCFEPCKYPKNHLSDNMQHTCVQHRVQGLRGTYWEPTDELVISFCNVVIQENKMFKHSPNDWIAYKDYHTLYPQWLIEKSSEESMYWKWVLVKYKTEFEKRNGRTFQKIPSSWQDITKQEAIGSVKY